MLDKTRHLAMAFVASCLIAFTAHGDSRHSLEGLWRVQDENVWVQISSVETGAANVNVPRLRGVVIRSDDAPDVVGTVLLRDVHRADSAKHWVGRLYSPRLQREVGVTIEQLSGDTIALQVRMGLLSRRVLWLRDGSVKK